jgi:hypothetical protein
LAQSGHTEGILPTNSRSARILILWRWIGRLHWSIPPLRPPFIPQWLYIDENVFFSKEGEKKQASLINGIWFWDFHESRIPFWVKVTNVECIVLVTKKFWLFFDRFCKPEVIWCLVGNNTLHRHLNPTQNRTKKNIEKNLKLFLLWI